MKKIYRCCICHNILREKPIRLVKQLYGIGNYKQYSTVEHYDICSKCYTAFDKWLIKHKEEDNGRR